MDLGRSAGGRRLCRLPDAVCLANRLTTAANTIFLQSTAPLYLLILAPWLLKEPVRRQDLGFMITVAAGLALFFVGVEQPIVTAPDPDRGNCWPWGAAFAGRLQSAVSAG
jgi:drug/metabolite transporter (DMT)-like permease